MAVSIKQLKTLKKGDYIKISYSGNADQVLYCKVLDVKKHGLVLSDPFKKGSRAEGEWFSKFDSEITDIYCQFWSIIRRNSEEAKGIEGKVE